MKSTGLALIDWSWMTCWWSPCKELQNIPCYSRLFTTKHWMMIWKNLSIEWWDLNRHRSKGQGLTEEATRHEKSVIQLFGTIGVSCYTNNFFSHLPIKQVVWQLIKVAQNSFQHIPRLRFWCAIITTLYQLMLQSWYQTTAQSLVNTLVLFSWHYRLL